MAVKTPAVNRMMVVPGTHTLRKLPTLLVAALVTFGATGAMAQTSHSGHTSKTAATGQGDYQAVMHAQMAKMNSDMTSAPMSGNPDLDFAMMMIPHHQGAIDMAKTQLKYGKDEKLRKMAQKIISAQEEEIQELKERISDLQRSVSGSAATATGSAFSEKKDE